MKPQSPHTFLTLIVIISAFVAVLLLALGVSSWLPVIIACGSFFVAIIMTFIDNPN